MKLIYEYVGEDPYFKGKPATTQDTLRRARIDALKDKPVMLQPVLNSIWRLVYVTYWLIFTILVRLGYAVGEYLRELANYGC